jgi:hypothetical protein
MSTTNPESRPRRWINVVLTIVAIAFGLLMINVVFPVLSIFPPRVYSHEQEVDLSTGRMRSNQYVLFCRTKSDVQETALSEALAGRPPVGEELWVCVDKSSPAGPQTSAHCPYQRATRQITSMWELWEVHRFEPDAKVKSATQLLRVWRRGGNDHAAGEYVSYFQYWLMDREEGRPVALDDIPDDLVERALARTLVDQLLAEQEAREAQRRLERLREQVTP